MSGPMKFGVGAASLLVIIFALVDSSCAQFPMKPYSPEVEAIYTILGTNEDELLPDPELVSKVAKMIVQIRKETEVPEVRKIRNQGYWYLGQVRVTNYSPALKQKIEQSEYGPLKEVKVSKGNKKEADLIFTKSFNPIELSRRLKKEFGAQAQKIEYDRNKIPDLGRMKYRPGAMDFKEGGNTWLFKVDENTGKIFLDGTASIE